MTNLTYSAITPVRDEGDNLERLAASLVDQTQPPAEWVIVDNGSIDRTPGVIESLGREHAWIRSIAIAGADRAVPGAPIVRAFHAGLDAMRSSPDVIVKLDADTSMEAEYFASLLSQFEADPKLGIAGGVCLEPSAAGWEETIVTGDHVRGAVRAYKAEFLREILPLEERVGWDGIDELQAAVLGWRTATIPGLAFFHHRKLGARDGGRLKRWQAQGRGAWFMGYRWYYLALRSLHHARRDPAALAMIATYAQSALRGEPRYADASVREYLRTQQSLTRLPRRRRETRGRA